MQTPYDYQFILKYIVHLGKNRYGHEYEIDHLDKPVVKKLLAYFLRDEKVAKEEQLDLDKGLLITGPIGCGKTSLMNIIRDIGVAAYKPTIKSCREISIEYAQQGFDVVPKYSTNAFQPYSSIPRIYCFDDLGLESLINYWGSNINIMAEILLSRYDFSVTHKMLTHATTNLNASELEAIYGNRLRSRMRSMFNLIAFNPDARDKRR
jgi:energy-coupling factor transporter ATP-binding protein EcfA2